MSRAAAVVFGVADLLGAALVAFGVFGALPDRWWPVDGGALVLIALLGGAGVGLLRGATWAERAARLAAAVSLLLGLLLVATLALTASYLSGIYGPVGHGGAVILVLVAALALPYLIVLPSVQLVWLRPGRARPGDS